MNPTPKQYRAFVGPNHMYDIMAAHQFNLLTSCGLRDTHKVLDIGCGSLRLGRLLLPFLNKGCYFGIEPEFMLVQEGIKNEIGEDILAVKEPSFGTSSEFEFGVFDNVDTFDYIMCQSIFTHASQEQIKKCLSEAFHVSDDGTTFLATYLESQGHSYSGAEWVYPTCVVYRHATIEMIARDAGWKTVKRPEQHPNGHTWVQFIK